MDALVNLERPLECISCNAGAIIDRIVTFLDIDRAYIGVGMTKVVNQVTELAEAAFAFHNLDDDDDCLYGFYNIIAVGILIYLRVPFLYILGFEKLPQSRFSISRLLYDTLAYTDARSNMLIACFSEYWVSRYASFIPEGFISMFFRSVERISETG